MIVSRVRVAVLILAAFTLSDSKVALGAILVAIALIVVAVALEFQRPSVVEIYLDTIAWLTAGLTLSSVVARSVFASGRVTFHRIIGAVLLYLSIGWVFVGLFSFVAFFVPDVFRGFGPSQGNFIAVAGDLIHCSVGATTFDASADQADSCLR
jgi:hypothetical protein